MKNAFLQWSAPEVKRAPIIPLVSTYYSNYSNETVLNVASQLIKNSNNTRIKKAFENVTFMQAFRQPANLLCTLSHSKFFSNVACRNIGVVKCNNKRCKICAIYIQEGTIIPMSNGKSWEIRCHANCSSQNVIYFLLCNFCNVESYIGKTDNTHANSKGMPLKELYFKLFIMMVCSNYRNLLDYESRFHLLNLDTLNRNKYH